jgi:hypothetical protein
MEHSKHRSYCFTLNNYTTEDEQRIQDIDAKYLVYGREVAPTTQTQHIQGYIQFHNPRSFNSTKKSLGKAAHLEQAKGNAEQNRRYCIKQDDNFFEKGDIQTQGKRTDLDKIREIVKDTNKMSDVVEVATSYQSVKMAECILKYKEKPRNWKPMVYWFYGSTGTGKTRNAIDLFQNDCYIKSNNDKWFEGYDAHERVLFDDFRSSTLPFHFLLQLLDRYACRVECKGSTRQFLAKHIIITTPYHPETMYRTNEDVMQLIRRIDKIENFDKNNTFVNLQNPEPIEDEIINEETFFLNH